MSSSNVSGSLGIRQHIVDQGLFMLIQSTIDVCSTCGYWSRRLTMSKTDVLKTGSSAVIGSASLTTS
ncbi:hypothetical protein Tco_0001921 [Tanacetum coccineum]